MWKHFLHNILLGSSFSQYFINLLVLLHSPLFCEKGTTVSTHIIILQTQNGSKRVCDGETFVSFG